MSACPNCGTALEAAAVVCPSCHRLTHEAELTKLREEALALERTFAFASARAKWIEMLVLLPHNTRQATWIVDRVQQLEGSTDETPEAQKASGWAARLGPLAAIVALLFKGKGLLALFNAKSLMSLGAFVWFYGGVYGWIFGVGFAASILIHELGHWVDIRRRGLPADMPVFLPGLGAYVRWRALGVSEVVRAEVSLAGPLAGLGAAIVCAILWWTTGAPIWSALARAGAWLNIMNLIPVWALDGGQAAKVLDRSQRVLLGSVALVLWLVTHEGVLLLVTAGAVWRLFTKDIPASPGRQIAAYFTALLVALSVVMWMMPGHGAGDF